MRGSRGVRTPHPPSTHTPLKNHKNIGFPSNTENHEATKPAFNVGPSSARQQNAIKMAFRWRADDGPLIVAFGSSLPSLTKINVVKVRPLWQNFLDPHTVAHHGHCEVMDSEIKSFYILIKYGSGVPYCSTAVVVWFNGPLLIWTIQQGENTDSLHNITF